MKTYSFEKLLCWQHGIRLTKWVYRVTASFPTEERYGMISQMKRAAISVISNIAEGSSRKSNLDQARFTVYAYSSAIELLNDFIIAQELGFMNTDDYEKGRLLIEEQTFLLSKLRQAQKKQSTKYPKPPSTS